MGSRGSQWFSQDYDTIRAGSIDGTDIYPHDRGLKHAATSYYSGHRYADETQDPLNTLFVGRLNYSTTEETLRREFSEYGEVARVTIIRDAISGMSRGYGFVEFVNEEDFREAFTQGFHKVIDGSTVLVDYQRSGVMPGFVPRRLGGGLGGHKESGQLRFGGRERPFNAPFDQPLFASDRLRGNAARPPL